MSKQDKADYIASVAGDDDAAVLENQNTQAEQEAEAAQSAQPEVDATPQFIEDSLNVCEYMRRIIARNTTIDYAGDQISEHEHQKVTVEACQVLLNASQAIELWRQQERQFQIQERMLREQAKRAEQMSRLGLVAGGGPLPPGLH